LLKNTSIRLVCQSPNASGSHTTGPARTSPDLQQNIEQREQEDRNADRAVHIEKSHIQF
jgi:hypothetical protein